MSEGRGCGLGADHRSAQQTATSYQVLFEQFSYDDGDVGHIHFVYQTIDALLERFPRNALVFDAVFVGDVFLHESESGRRNVSAAGSAEQIDLALRLVHRRLAVLLSDLTDQWVVVLDAGHVGGVGHLGSVVVSTARTAFSGVHI